MKKCFWATRRKGGKMKMINCKSQMLIIVLPHCALTAAGTTPSNPRSTNTYTYASSGWGDRLTAYNGTAITYDDMGNPVSYSNGAGSYTFTWSGRQATTIQKGPLTYYLTYNDEGMRTSKTVNGVTTTYYVSGTQILAEETNGNVTVYLYDSEGAPLGMQYHGASYEANVWDIFWYERNVFGDIVAVYDEAGTLLATYTYDAYGVASTLYYNGGSNTRAFYNPFRYRGYYYDRDLSLYYLSTRYYDCRTGRFVQPADILNATSTDISGNNLYSYANDPIGESNALIPVKAPLNSVTKAPSNSAILAMSSKNISLSLLISIKSDVNHRDIHWQNKWVDTDWPSFLVLSQKGLKVVDWGLSIYKGRLYFDNSATHSFYVSVGNIGIYSGFNYEEGIGFEAGASALEIGYEGQFVNVSVEGGAIGITYMYKDGKFELGCGSGLFGWSVSIDLVELHKQVFGG